MNAVFRRIFTCLAASAVLATVASAGQQATTPQAAPQAAPGPEYVESSGFKSRIYEVKYRDPASLVPVLRPLASGYKGATISASTEYRTLSVRDVPENLAVIEEALKRLDVPQAPRADIELHLHVLLASSAGPSSEIPQEIRGAVGQLKSTLTYTSFSLLTPIVQRTREGEWNTQGQGEVSTGTNDLVTYSYLIRSVTRSTDVDNVARVQLNGFQFVMRGPRTGEANVQSNLSLKDGEQVVVGTASVRGGQALVLVLSAKVAK